MTFAHPNDIIREFDVTPPSLYAFPKGEEPWTSDHSGYTEIAGTALGSIRGAHCYFAEKFDEGDNEYRRTVWVSR